MSNDSKNNAEAMLKAYAERRRAEAGPPIEPHPVTRKLLHDEVAKTFPPGSGAAPSWRQLFLGMIPRFAIAAGVSAALVIAVYLVHRDQPVALTMAMNQPLSGGKPVAAPAAPESSERRDEAGHAESLKSLAPATPATLDAEKKFAEKESPLTLGGNLKDGLNTDELARRNLALAGNEADRSKVQAARFGGAGNLESDAKRMTPAAAPPPVELQQLSKSESGPAPLPAAVEEKQAAIKTRASEPAPVIAADTATSPPAIASVSGAPASAGKLGSPGIPNSSQDKATAAGDVSSLAFNAKVPATLAEVPVPGAAPASPTSQNFYFREATGELRQSFSQVNQRAQYRQNFNSPKPSPVLNNFQLERAGNRIQVTDSDGSVYLGSVVLTDALQGMVPAAPPAKPAGNARVQATPLVGASAIRKDASATVQNAAQDSNQANFAFQVAGTNRTVKKVVIFNGTLNIDPSLNGAAQQIPPAGFGGAQNRAQNTANAAQNFQNRVITNQAGLIQNGRLSGQAVVGGREKLPIDAVPVTP